MLLRKTKKELLKNVDYDTACLVQGFGNTVEYTKDNFRFIRLYKTDVLTFCGNKTVTLNTGGFYTDTTKRRINVLQDIVRVYQAGYCWYVKTVKAKDNKVYKFHNGITFDVKTGKKITSGRW